MSNLRFDNVETTFEILTDEINETLVKEIISNLDSRILLLKNESIDILIPL